jgi:excisionase family DNA binding protein
VNTLPSLWLPKNRSFVHRRKLPLQNEVLTVTEVANYLRVSRVTVWRWCQQGLIPASQVGRNWRIRRGDVLQLFEPTNRSDGSGTKTQ